MSEWFPIKHLDNYLSVVSRGGGHVHDPFVEGFNLISLKGGKEQWAPWLSATRAHTSAAGSII